MIDVLTESILTPLEAVAYFPRHGGKKVHVSAIYRYMRRGLRGVVLESIQCGSLRCTSRQAVARFLSRLSARNSTSPDSSASGPPGLSARAREVELELERNGL